MKVESLDESLGNCHGPEGKDTPAIQFMENTPTNEVSLGESRKWG